MKRIALQIAWLYLCGILFGPGRDCDMFDYFLKQPEVVLLPATPNFADNCSPSVPLSRSTNNHEHPVLVRRCRYYLKVRNISDVRNGSQPMPVSRPMILPFANSVTFSSYVVCRRAKALAAPSKSVASGNL